jgi:DNA-binding response OmpR family regulator
LLVVDDDAAVRRIMAATLQQAGYQVLSAADGEVAMDMLTRLAKAQRPLDAMLLDVHMPRISGIDLLDRMRQAGMVLPVIAVTGDQDRMIVIELMRRGVSELLDKPVQVDVLVATVRAFLERNQLLAERRRALEQQLKLELEAAERDKHDNQRKAREASDSYYRLEAQVQSARTVWNDLTGLLVPPAGVSLAWRTRPLSDLGGDFVGLRATPRGCLLLVADVAGHDMGASLHGVLIKAFFEENCRSGLAGEEFLRRLNRQLVQSTAQRRLVTAQLIDVDLQQHVATVVSAGHPAVVRQSATGSELITTEGAVLGITEEIVLAPSTVPFTPGDRLFIVTDGISDLPRTDGRTGTRERYGLAGLQRDLALHAATALEAQIQATWDAAIAFCRKRPVDDMVLVGLGCDLEIGGDDYAPTDRIGDTSTAHLRSIVTPPPG